MPDCRERFRFWASQCSDRLPIIGPGVHALFRPFLSSPLACGDRQESQSRSPLRRPLPRAERPQRPLRGAMRSNPRGQARGREEGRAQEVTRGSGYKRERPLDACGSEGPTARFGSGRDPGRTHGMRSSSVVGEAGAKARFPHASASAAQRPRDRLVLRTPGLRKALSHALK
jgi:hypothetical protein